MHNMDIRQAIKMKRLFYFEVAQALGIADSTFSRWMRQEMPQEKKKNILSVIDQLAREKQEVI